MGGFVLSLSPKSFLFPSLFTNAPHTADAKTYITQLSDRPKIEIQRPEITIRVTPPDWLTPSPLRYIIPKPHCFSPHTHSHCFLALILLRLEAYLISKGPKFLRWPEGESPWVQALPRSLPLGAARPVCSSRSVVSPGSSKPASTRSASAPAHPSTSQLSLNISPPRSDNTLLLFSSLGSVGLFGCLETVGKCTK